MPYRVPLDPCRRCGGEEWLESDSGALVLCPACHGSGHAPRALPPKDDPLPCVACDVDPLPARPRPTVRFMGVTLDAETFQRVAP